MLRMAAAIMHRQSQLWLWQTTHNRDSLIPNLRNGLGRRRRVSVIIVGRKGIGRTSVGNELQRREHQEIVMRMERPGTGQGILAGQQCTVPLSRLSPIQPSHKNY